MRKISNPDARAYIRDLKPFTSHTENFRGEAHNPGAYVYTGYLPESYRVNGRLDDADYIVYSYATPIAWHLTDGWVIPDVRYSNTTSSRHMPNLPWGEPMSAHQAPSLAHLSVTVANIIRAARRGYGTSAEGRTRKTIDAVLSTGEVILTNDGKDFYPKFLADRSENAPFALV